MKAAFIPTINGFCVKWDCAVLGLTPQGLGRRNWIRGERFYSTGAGGKWWQNVPTGPQWGIVHGLTWAVSSIPGFTRLSRSLGPGCSRQTGEGRPGRPSEEEDGVSGPSPHVPSDSQLGTGHNVPADHSRSHHEWALFLLPSVLRTTFPWTLPCGSLGLGQGSLTAFQNPQGLLQRSTPVRMGRASPWPPGTAHPHSRAQGP